MPPTAGYSGHGRRRPATGGPTGRELEAPSPAGGVLHGQSVLLRCAGGRISGGVADVGVRRVRCVRWML